MQCVDAHYSPWNYRICPLAYELSRSTGSTDSMKFMDFLQGSLMQPFPDKHSVITRDL